MQAAPIKVIIGLGNPGAKYFGTRHNIGFRVLDALADAHGGTWSTKDIIETCTVDINGHRVILIKPLTFMNSSGRVIPALAKQGIKAENILVVHDELEKKFGAVVFKMGGGHRGHNGLRSIIEACGQEFARIRFGIGRPASKADVPDYVLENFSEPAQEVERGIETAVGIIKGLYQEAAGG